MEPLTKRQAQILAYIKDCISLNNYAPSYREICSKFGLSSTATVAEHIESLKTKGYLTQEDNQARSLQVIETENPDGYVAVPLMGMIAAGKPIEAVKSDETIDIPRDMSGHNVYALRVRGQSMIEDGILENDYVIIEHAQTAKNGDIVVALIDNDSVTLKRFYKEKDRVRLQPANSSMAPMYFKNVAIQGKVRGLIRRFV